MFQFRTRALMSVRTIVTLNMVNVLTKGMDSTRASVQKDSMGMGGSAPKK